MTKSIDNQIQEQLYFYGDRCSTQPTILYVGKAEYDMLRGYTKKEYYSIKTDDVRETYRGLDVIQVARRQYIGFGV